MDQGCLNGHSQLFRCPNTLGEAAQRLQKNNNRRAEKQNDENFLKRIATLAVLMLLSACTGADFVSLGPTDDAVRSVDVRGGDVTIAAPSGFCIETGISKPQDGFVVMGGCDVITRGKAFGPVNNAIIVVSVSQERADGLASSSRLASMVGPKGVLDTKTTEGVSLVHLASGGDSYIPGGDPRNWQGVATINGYLILMSVYSEVGGTASKTSGGDLVVNLAQVIRLNSPFRMLPKPPKLRPT